MEGPVDQAITRLARGDASRVLALIADRFGSIEIADDAVQEALISAAATWPERGVPLNPAGWLMTAARRKAIDRIRSDRAELDRRQKAGELKTLESEPLVGGATDLIEDSDLNLDEPDSSQLRLMLLCCHPALDPDSRVALTLRLVGGLTTPEIATAFLLNEATLAQRIVRAKRKIRAAAIPMTMPAHINDRLAILLRVLYLIFNEGYLSSFGETGLTRSDLQAEAIRLTELLAELTEGVPEVDGLLALQLFSAARSETREDDLGELVLLSDQDRGRWDRPSIERANTILNRAMAAMAPGPYQVQAIIASHHANAVSDDTTDWATIADLYLQLDQMTDSDIVRLNRCVAVGKADGPHAGLSLADTITSLDSHHRFHAVRAELLRMADRPQESIEAIDRALELKPPPAEDRFLRRRRQMLES